MAAVELKRNDVARWYRERTGDARTVMQSRLGADEIQAFVTGNQADAAEAALHAWATSLRQAYGYRTIALYGGDGQVWLQDGAAAAPVHREALQQALRTRDVAVDDIDANDQSGRRQLAFLAPLPSDHSGWCHRSSSR
ncbi:MAG: hypothetical protein QM736_15035 [Vicinamibacterales bacterium]